MNEKAEEAYIKAAQLRPDDWNGFNSLGNFYDDIGKHKEAVNALQRAMRLAPDNAYIYCNLGAAYIDSGDLALFAEAEKAFLKSISLNPTYEAYTNLGNLYGIEQRFKESAESTEKALALDDQNFEVWNNLSQAYEGMGDQERAKAPRARAITLAKRAVALNSQNAGAHGTLAELLARDNHRDEANSHILTALALAPKDQEILSEVAKAYDNLGDRKHAINYLQQALQNGLPSVQLNGDPGLRRISTDPHFRSTERVNDFETGDARV